MRKIAAIIVPILVFLLPVIALGLNQVQVTVPAQNGNGPQELRLGEAGEIYISITNDVPLNAVEIPLEVLNENGPTLWTAVADLQVEFLLDSTTFALTDFMGIWQDGIWPDTTETIFVSGNLPPGEHLLFKITVTPLESGIATWKAPDFTYGPTIHEMLFCVVGSECVTPDFFAPDITVLGGDCNGNGVDDNLDISSGTSADCNGNSVPDECDLSAGTSPDFNQNEIPDECEGWSADQVMVYVPPGNGHGSQEMIVGQPNEIWVAVQNTSELSAMEIPLEVSASGGGSLWPLITETQVEFLPESESFLLKSVMETWEDGNWPDTVDLLLVSGALPPGLHNLAKITVVPTDTGTVHWSGLTFTYGPTFHDLQFCQTSGICFGVDLVAPDIVIRDDPGACCIGDRGDVNNDGAVDVTDLTFLVDFIFNGGPTPDCMAEADVNGSGGTDVVDLTYFVDYLFNGGPPPAPC